MKPDIRPYSPPPHLFNPLRYEAHLNNIYKFSFYLEENKCLHYKPRLIKAVQEIIYLFSERYETMNTFCGQNGELFNAEARGTYGHHCASQVLISM
jgi:hypothetical protein